MSGRALLRFATGGRMLAREGEIFDTGCGFAGTRTRVWLLLRPRAAGLATARLRRIIVQACGLAGQAAMPIFKP